jgi:hypothetical protein
MRANFKSSTPARFGAKKTPRTSLGVKVVSHVATGRGLGPAGTKAAEVTPSPSCVPKLPLAGEKSRAMTL